MHMLCTHAHMYVLANIHIELSPTVSKSLTKNIVCNSGCAFVWYVYLFKKLLLSL